MTKQEQIAQCRAHWEATKPEAVFADYWLGWKAARESMVIDLPAPEKHYSIMGDPNDPDLILDYSSVVLAVESAGARVKS